MGAECLSIDQTVDRKLVYGKRSIVLELLGNHLEKNRLYLFLIPSTRGKSGINDLNFKNSTIEVLEETWEVILFLLWGGIRL